MAEAAIARTKGAPLLLELELGDACALMELDADEDRAFSVGSSRYADVRIHGVGVSPIEFYLERRVDAVWLVPAYRGRALRVAGTRVTGPVALELPAVIEFAGRRAIVRHRYPRNDQPTSVQRPKPLRREHLRREHTASIPPDELPRLLYELSDHHRPAPVRFPDRPPSRPPVVRPSTPRKRRAVTGPEPHLWTTAARRPFETLAFTLAVATLVGLAYAGVHLSSSSGAP
ncbi:MAG: hypothetical protein DIU78_015520 [Pseudomonadota bacterium]